MRAALVIAAKDLRQRLRDRSAIIVAVIAPFGLAAIFGLLLGGTEDGLDLRYAYVDLDGSAISSALRDGALAGLEEAGVATITEVDSRDAAEAAIDAGDVSAALIVPAGYASAVQSAETADLQIIGSTQAGLATDILQAVSTSFTAELDGIRVATGTAASAMGITDPAAIGELGARAAHTTSPLTVQAVDSELQQIVPATFYAASMAIFFLFFTAQFGVLSLLTERRQGTLPRLVAAPISPSAIVLGKAIGSFALGIVAMTVLVVATTMLLGARWGDPIAVAILVLAAVTAAMGITALITTLARTEEQAGGWNSIVAVTLAILGGAFFNLSQGPEILTQVSFLTPHAWFLEGLDRLAAPSSDLADIALPAAALFAMGLVTGAIGLVRARGLVVSR